MTTEQLVEMVRDAHQALADEIMNCPWCEGKIGQISEWHNPACVWKQFEKDYRPNEGSVMYETI